MSENLNRRGFIRKSLAASTGAALGFHSLEEKILLAATAENPTAPESKGPTSTSKGNLPMAKIGNLKVSRLISGGNLIGGWAHARDLIYVSPLVKAYNDDERLLDTMEMLEENGVNTLLTNNSAWKIINRYWKERGGKIQWISEGFPKADDLKTNMQKTIDRGAHAIYVQGAVGDRWIKHGRVELLGKALDFIKESGLVGGIGGHSVEVPKACEKAGFKPDFYMKTLHHGKYWSATPVEERVEFNVDTPNPTNYDNIWCIKPEETIEVMKKTEVPWIAFKILAAGAIHPRDGFKYAFENGADVICVGMFDFQLTEDVLIAKKILAGNLKRERPWRA